MPILEGVDRIRVEHEADAGHPWVVEGEGIDPVVDGEQLRLVVAVEGVDTWDFVDPEGREALVVVGRATEGEEHDEAERGDGDAGGDPVEPRGQDVQDRQADEQRLHRVVPVALVEGRHEQQVVHAEGDDTGRRRVEEGQLPLHDR